MSQEVDEKMIFTWSFWAFYDIPGPGKYVFSHSVCGKSTRYSNRLHDFSVAISECYIDILKEIKEIISTLSFL